MSQPQREVLTAMAEQPVYMVIFPHPDDAEIYAGGTVRKLTSQGHRVFYACLTNGNVGSYDRSMTRERLAEIRRQELTEAATVLGVAKIFFLGYEDSTLYPSLEMRAQVVRLLRIARADIVLGLDPWRENLTHIDHRTAAWVAIEAASNAGWHLAHHEQFACEGIEPHEVREVHLFDTDDASHYVDITDTIEDKVKACLCHRSQIGFGVPKGDELRRAMAETADRVRRRARELGAKRGYQYAEAFKVLELGAGHARGAGRPGD
jgi:LmbE family N-acetylglucosaminyl deacetylase